MSVPVERRPLEVYPRHGADARALALKSHREQQQRERSSQQREARATKRTTTAARLSPSAEAYAKAEERWQRELRRKGRRAGQARPRRVASYIENAKAKRARYRRYPDSEGRLADFALSPFGKDWQIDNARDVARAVLAVQVGPAAGPDEDRIRAWVQWRAEQLGVAELVPPGWKGVWQ